MLLVLLCGAGAGLCWGTADFFGGLQSRHLPVLAVTLWSQIAGALALVCMLLVQGELPVPIGMAWGAAGGLFGATALVLFYRGLATGVMSLVAPISACGAIVPVVVSFALGEVPSALAIVGIATAIAGIILVSLQPRSIGHDRRNARLAIILALGSALGFGMFYVFINHAGDVSSGSALWPVVGAKIGSFFTLLGMIALGPRAAPWPGNRAGIVAGIGIVDTLANVLFAYASEIGSLGIAAVLGSLYPVATIMLGRFILAERLSAIQQAGVVLALIGVALLSAG